jgi:hypothetical protein
MKSYPSRLAALVPVAVLIVACGGSAFTSGAESDAASDGSSGGGSTSSGATSSGGPSSDAAGSSGDSGGMAEASSSGITPGEGGAVQDATPPPADSGAPCPTVAGSYTIVVSGLGCTGANPSAPECITQSGCDIKFTSSATAGNAINGTATMDPNGSFMDAALTEGTAMRSGCSGNWSPSLSTMTVDCGGSGSSQSCRLVLTREALVCG